MALILTLIDATNRRLHATPLFEWLGEIAWDIALRHRHIVRQNGILWDIAKATAPSLEWPPTVLVVLLAAVTISRARAYRDGSDAERVS